MIIVLFKVCKKSAVRDFYSIYFQICLSCSVLTTNTPISIEKWKLEYKDFGRVAIFYYIKNTIIKSTSLSDKRVFSLLSVFCQLYGPHSMKVESYKLEYIMLSILLKIFSIVFQGYFPWEPAIIFWQDHLTNPRRKLKFRIYRL